MLDSPIKDFPKFARYLGTNFADIVTLTTPHSHAAGPGTLAGHSHAVGPGTLAGYTVSFSTTGNNTGQPPLSLLLPPVGTVAMGSISTLDLTSSVMYVNHRTSIAIERLSSEGGSDPKEASGLWPRMCYFSAITITTLGFGDITPVSSWARLLVGSEAVSGVVLIGLFLNATAKKWGKAS